MIFSDHRFTYEDAQTGLETGEGPFASELKTLNQLAEKLREKRYQEGSVSFETEEVRFRLDETGKPLGIYLKERKAAHMLVEDFMLLANRQVATFLAKMREKDSTWP